MQQNKTHRLVGLFVLIGFLCLGSIIFYNVSKKFDNKEDEWIVMYFDESVRGLNVGSAVLFQGVEIGKVEKIKLIADLKQASFQTPVFVSLNLNADIESRYLDEDDDSKLLTHLIEKGLRARLISANYLTGQLMIELRMDPKQPPILKGRGQYLEIPTEYSPFAMLSNDLQEIPLREIIGRFGDLISDIDEKIPGILTNMAQLTDRLDKTIESKSSETTKTLHNFNETLEEVSKASRSLKNLTDYLERHPESVIQGKGDNK